jgi:hypothetical protein
LRRGENDLDVGTTVVEMVRFRETFVTLPAVGREIGARLDARSSPSMGDTRSTRLTAGGVATAGSFRSHFVAIRAWQAPETP